MRNGVLSFLLAVFISGCAFKEIQSMPYPPIHHVETIAIEDSPSAGGLPIITFFEKNNTKAYYALRVEEENPHVVCESKDLSLKLFSYGGNSAAQESWILHIARYKNGNTFMLLEIFAHSDPMHGQRYYFQKHDRWLSKRMMEHEKSEVESNTFLELLNTCYYPKIFEYYHNLWKRR